MTSHVVSGEQPQPKEQKNLAQPPPPPPPPPRQQVRQGQDEPSPSPSPDVSEELAMVGGGHALKSAASNKSSLSASSEDTTSTSTTHTAHNNAKYGTREVLYNNEGGTPLFAAIQDTAWRKAYDLAEEHPAQIRTWIKSTGTENTTFGWSMWRRLPIHEACRRQAPAWMVAILLSSFPESARCSTQFGELPLHLAVECGAPPEVVNLLVVAHWEGLVTRDKSGRTPADVLQETADDSMFNDEHDQRVVLESLTRGAQTYNRIQEEWKERIRQLELQHEDDLEQVRKSHEDDLTMEHKRIASVEQKMRSLRSHVEVLQEEIVQKDRKIASLRAEERNLIDRLRKEEEEVERLESDKRSEQQTVLALESEMHNMEEQIDERETYIETLSNDLSKLSHQHENHISEALQRNERCLQEFVENHMNLAGMLKRQAKGLKVLLRERGIDLLADQQAPHSPTPHESTGRQVSPKTTPNSSTKSSSKSSKKSLSSSNPKVMASPSSSPRRSSSQYSDASSAANSAVVAAAVMSALQQPLTD